MAYRVTDHVFSLGVDEWGDPLPGGQVRLVVSKTPILKNTPTGFRIYDRFCSEKTTKRFACRTFAEAKESFIERKKSQIARLELQLSRAKEALELGIKLEEGK